MFNDLERSIFSDLLEAISQRLSNDSCNEFCVAVTPDNTAELESLIHVISYDADHTEHLMKQVGGGVQVFFNDHDLVDYLKDKIAK